METMSPGINPDGSAVEMDLSPGSGGLSGEAQDAKLVVPAAK